MITINQDKCIGCGQCVRDCFPVDIELQNGKAIPKNDKCFECGHCVAVCPVDAIAVDGYDMSEVVEMKGLCDLIDPEVYLNQMKSRRTIRQFRDTPVTEEQLNLILEAGRYAPTGGNAQNVAYNVIQKNITPFREKLIDQLKVMGDGMIAAGKRASFYTDMWLDMYEDYHKEGKDRLFFGAGTVICLSSNDPMSVGIAAAHMETMVYSLGLGMLYSGFSRFAIESNEEIRESLQLQDGYHVHAVLVIGEPAVRYQRTVPRKKAQIIWD